MLKKLHFAYRNRGYKKIQKVEKETKKQKSLHNLKAGCTDVRYYKTNRKVIEAVGWTLSKWKANKIETTLLASYMKSHYTI